MSFSHCCIYPTWDCIIIIIIIITVSNEKQRQRKSDPWGSFVPRRSVRPRWSTGSAGCRAWRLARQETLSPRFIPLYTNSLPSSYTCVSEETDRSACMLMKYCIHREGAPEGARQGSSWRRTRTVRLPKGTSRLKGDFWVWSFNYVAEALVNTLLARRRSEGCAEKHITRPT